jgi:quinol monooxygenase YgiN
LSGRAVSAVADGIVRYHSPSDASCLIFDTFDDEAGRDAHLNGKVAAALMEKAKAGDLFAKAPEVHKLGILADKLPK